MPQEPQGQCLYCGTTNSYSSLSCCSCYTELPWASALTQMLAQAQTAAPNQPANQLAPVPPYASLQAQPPLQAQMQVQPPLHASMQAATQPALAAPKYCAHCGSAQAATAYFCSGCGTAILSAQQPNAPQSVPRLAWNWPLPTAAPTAMAPAQSGHPAQGGFMFSPQQSVNVNVVTEHKTENKRGGRGLMSRLFGLFFMGCSGLAVLALAGGAPGAFVVCAALAFFGAVFMAFAK